MVGVPLAVSFCFAFFACGCKFGALVCLLCPQGTARTSGRPSYHITNSTTQASGHIGNLRAHIPTTRPTKGRTSTPPSI
jgi:hypothetical protein